MADNRAPEPLASQQIQEPSEMSKVLHELADEADRLDTRLHIALGRIGELQQERINLLERLGRLEALVEQFNDGHTPPEGYGDE